MSTLWWLASARHSSDARAPKVSESMTWAHDKKRSTLPTRTIRKPPSRFKNRETQGRLFRGVYGGLGVRCVEWVTARWSERIRLLHETSQERAVMGKGITGLDRTQLSCLVEMVLGDTEISLAPRILGPLLTRDSLVGSGF